MIVVELVGGLGNQLFEYSMARALSIGSGEKLYLNASNYYTDNLRKFELGFFNISARVIKEKNIMIDPMGFAVLFVSKHILSRTRLSNTEIRLYGFQDVRGSKYLRGFWQNTLYFESITDILRAELSINTDKLPHVSKCKYLELADKIIRGNSVAVHIRRTDYLSHSNDFFVLDEAYYMNAIKYISTNIQNPVFYVFSDDIEWCKKQTRLFAQLPVIYVDNTVQYSEIVDFALMKCCKHFIIANSTYSWWAAFLGSSPEKIVVSSKYWVKDLKKNEEIIQALLGKMVLL